MLEFSFEWEEAPGVTSPALAASWARIEITIDGDKPSRFWSSASNSVRSGVHASAFPLARMIARNWWNLLNEPFPAPEVLRGGRSASRQYRSWLERHNLIFSREGMSYPDVSFYREDGLIGARWVPDTSAVTTPGRFIEAGFARLDPSQASAGLARAIEAVLERLEGVEGDEVSELRADWEAVRTSSAAESALCERLATLDLDPYAPDLDDGLIEHLSEEALPEYLLRDLLPATTPECLAKDIHLVERHVHLLPPLNGVGQPPINGTFKGHHDNDPLPYRAGYSRAEALRRHFQIEATGRLDDLETVVRKALERDYHWIDAGEPTQRNVDAVVQNDGTCAIASRKRHPLSHRFMLARALHHWLFTARGATPWRLLTRASDWQQAASRAFAAELLAPAAALSERLRGAADWDIEDQLAEEFQVSRMVIAHQLENHGLHLG